MREIKFRAKNLYEDYLRINKDDEELTKIGPGQIWVYGGYAEIDGRGFIFPEGKTHFGHGDYWTDDDVLDIPIVDKNTLGQFTGLTDKNGREIYEGDVFLDTEYYEPTYRKIVYRNGQWEAVASDGIWFPLLKDQEPLSDELRHIEVIGNIHDNPELLKQ